MLSRILHGTRGTLQIGLISIMLGGFGGAIVGVIGAYFRRVDLVIMRIVDVLLSFPSVLVALALAGVLGPGQLTLTIALAVAAFPAATRIARSAALTVVHREYVESARAVGLPTYHILLRYVLRNCAPEVIAYLTLQFGQVMLMAVSLSFLGLGTRPPTPELGSMIGDGRSLLFTAPHVALVPTAVVFLLIMSVNLIGDALRDRLDQSKT
jgi:ABC-type dipeptide/oligopeptide/nickel transport system permease subunit